MLAILDDFIRRLGSAQDIAVIYAILGDTLGQLGFGKFSYAILRAPEGMQDEFWISTYPNQWMEHYFDRNYDKNDPIFLHAAATVTPFRWDHLALRISKALRQPLDEATEFGISNGITIPVRGPGRCYATFSVTASVSGTEFEALWAQHHHLLHLLTLHAHEAIIKQIYQSPMPSGLSLSPRERECLLWTAKGKTAWEIGQILNLTEETVATYLKSATRKLEVNNKYHAVVKSIVLGIIIP